MSNIIYQTGTINSLVDAVYTGDKTIAEVMRNGDFGLGTFDCINGELMACDGVCYRAGLDGAISIADASVNTPFAVVSEFHSHHEFEVSNLSYAELEQKLEDGFESHNIVYAIRVEAKFKQISFRSEECFTKSKLKLAQLLPKIQHAYTYSDIEGTLIGVWYPHYMSNINVPGFHFHFVDHARTVGGHVFAFELGSGLVKLQDIHELRIDLINSKEFHEANLDQDQTDAIRSVEKMR